MNLSVMGRVSASRMPAAILPPSPAGQTARFAFPGIRPAAQAMPSGVYAIGPTAQGYSFRINCAEWMALSLAGKRARAASMRPNDPDSAVRTIDAFCMKRLGGGIRPAGQGFGSDFSSLGSSVNFNTDGTATDSSGDTYDATGKAVTGTSSSGPSQAELNMIGGAINTVGTTVASIIASGDRVRMAELNNETQTAIARIQASAAEAQAAGNRALAAQEAQRASELQAFQQRYLLGQQPSYTGLYIVGGVVVLGIIGTFVYLASRKSSHKNPRMPQEAIDRNIAQDIAALEGRVPEGQWGHVKDVLTWLRGNEMSMLANFFVDSLANGRFSQFYIDDRVYGSPVSSGYSRGRVTKRDVTRAIKALHVATATR